MAANQARGLEWMARMIEDAAPGVFTDEEKRARAHALVASRAVTAQLADRTRIEHRSIFTSLVASFSSSRTDWVCSDSLLTLCKPTLKETGTSGRRHVGILLLL